MKKSVIVILLLTALAGIIGAGLSVVMVIRAIEWSEWGRVILYCVTTAICVELTALSVGKLRAGIRKGG